MKFFGIVLAALIVGIISANLFHMAWPYQQPDFDEVLEKLENNK